MSELKHALKAVEAYYKDRAYFGKLYLLDENTYRENINLALALKDLNAEVYDPTVLYSTEDSLLAALSQVKAELKGAVKDGLKDEIQDEESAEFKYEEANSDKALLNQKIFDLQMSLEFLQNLYREKFGGLGDENK